MKTRYIIEVTTKHPHDTERYSIFYMKCYGDQIGGARGADNEEEVLKDLQTIIKNWGEYDHILGRQSDPITSSNLHFDCCIKEITKEHVISTKRGISLLNLKKVKKCL